MTINLEIAWKTLISAGIGGLVATILTKLISKTARFRYSAFVQRVALSADDPIFGSVRITWRNNPMRNLYMADLEVENCSSRDFENVDFKVYVPKETFLLNERTLISDTPYIVKWAESYRSNLFVPAGAQATADQIDIYHHSRDYHLQVFNRGQLLKFSYLCTRPNDDIQPGVFISTQVKGARLRFQHSNLIFGVPVHLAVIRGLVLSALTVTLCASTLRSPLFASGISMVIGLFAQLLGAWEYKLERWVLKLIAG